MAIYIPASVLNKLEVLYSEPSPSQQWHDIREAFQDYCDSVNELMKLAGNIGPDCVDCSSIGRRGLLFTNLLPGLNLAINFHWNRDLNRWDITNSETRLANP